MPTKTTTYRTHLGCHVVERSVLNVDQGRIESHIELSTLAVEPDEQTRDRLNRGKKWPPGVRA